MEYRPQLAQKLIEENLNTRAPFLDLGNCGLTDNSPELFLLEKCQHLTKLSLGKQYYNDSNKEVNTNNSEKANWLTTIPPMLPDGLEELQIRDAGIERIDNLVKFSNLKLLDLSLNGIKKIENLEPLVSLRELALHGNFITNIENINHLDKLEILHLTRNKIVKIENIEKLQSLKELFLSANEISEIENINKLILLEHLDLNTNKISEIKNLEYNTKLEKISLSDNKILKINGVSNCRYLTRLDLAGNNISKIENLDNLDRLFSLDLNSNNISKIENLASLKELYMLFLMANKVKKLENLEKIENLNHLYVFNNFIEEIKPILSLPNLSYFGCSGNPITDCPSDVWETNDIKQIRAYFEKQPLSSPVNKNKTIPVKKIEISKAHAKKKNTDAVILKEPSAIQLLPTPVVTKDIKLILLGNSSSGKTNLVHYLQTGEFLSDRKTTHGLEVIRWQPDEKRFPLLKNKSVSIWDFGGQEYYHEAYRLFLSANAVYAVLWEKATDCNFRKLTKVEEAKPDEELEHFEKKYWLDTVRFYGDNRETAPLLLLQNKVDDQLIDKLRISQDMFDEYSLTECYHISLKEGCNAANTQQVRILQSFERELENILATAADKAENVPEWQQVRTAIISMQEEPDAVNAFKQYIKDDTWIELQDFNKACQQITNNALTPNDLYTLPRWLDKGGAVVYFENNMLLNKKVFISPKTLSKKLYEVLNTDVLKNNGEFLKDNIHGSGIFKTVFIEAAKSLGLVFDHPNKPNHFIAPQYLPAAHAIEDLFKIASANAWQDSYWIKVPLFHYKKLLNHLILTYTKAAGNDARYFWKHGIVFMKNKLRVMIKGLYPLEKQTEGIILVGVEEGDSRKTIQAEIFQTIFNYNEEQGKATVNIEKSKLMEMPASAERQTTGIAPGGNPKFLKALNISYDNENYESYDRLKELADKRQDFFSSKETSQRLSMHRFSPILPFVVTTRPPKKVFISYSHQNTTWLNKLRVHLSGLRQSGLVEEWTDQAIQAGEKWDKKIKENMEKADVFICLLSADFTASDYIWNTELKVIFETLKKRNAKVIFIYVEPFDLGSISNSSISDDSTQTKILDFEIIPKNEKGHLTAASLWINENQALAEIVKKIREAIG